MVAVSRLSFCIMYEGIIYQPGDSIRDLLIP